MKTCDLDDLDDFTESFFKQDPTKALCFEDISGYKLRGNLLSTKPSRTYGFTLTRCEGKDSCKSEEEIDEFIRSSTINILYTSEKFNVNVYGTRSDVIKSETVSEYLDLPRKGMRLNT